MKMVTKKIGLLLFLLVGLFTQMQAQTFAVNSNLLLLSTQTYNLGAEITVGDHTTLGLSVFGNNKPYFHKDMRTIGVQPEFKYYFGGRPMYHHYVGIGLLAADYSITWGNRKYDGTAWGGGMTFGYVISLSKRWNLDFHGGVGAIFSHHKEFMVNGDDLLLNDNSQAKDGFWEYRILPTKLGITLSYTIW